MRGLSTMVPSTRSNKPIASKTNENHQKKYPIPNLDTNPPGLRSTYQCELRTKVATATHAETRLTERDPLTATQGEPKINKTVATTLPVASRVSYHVPNTVSVRGHEGCAGEQESPPSSNRVNAAPHSTRDDREKPSCPLKQPRSRNEKKVWPPHRCRPLNCLDFRP